MFLVFRAAGADFDPRKFVAKHQLQNCSFWLRGEPSGSKTIAQKSGFRLPLPDADTGPEAVVLIQTFVKENEPWLDVLKAEGISCEIDIGLTLGSRENCTASVAFDSPLLKKLADCRIGLVCSAYPSEG